MKKIFNTFASIVLVSGLLFASPFDSNDFDDEFRRMQHYINSVFDSHFSSSYRHGLYPKANFYDKNNQYILEFELAGVDKKDINVSIVKDNLLTIEGNKKREIKTNNRSQFREELYFGKFKRVVQLPKNSDAEKIDVKHRNGILTITIPKTTPKIPKSKVLPIN
ncbi:MAG: Hsp20/alpha crystallin family protein [Campylobacterales bacterium]|nr:Hsp20/alpha crystallin family protein [Campylobacterales bacterium]